MSSQTDPITEATRKMCVAYQRDSAKRYAASRNPPNWAPLHWITAWQEDGAKEAAQARIRLDRLNGHA